MLAILSEEKAQILRHVNAEFAAKTEELSSQLAAMGLPQAVEEGVRSAALAHVGGSTVQVPLRIHFGGF